MKVDVFGYEGYCLWSAEIGISAQWSSSVLGSDPFTVSSWQIDIKKEVPTPGKLSLYIIYRIIDSKGNLYIILTFFSQPNSLLYYLEVSPLNAAVLTLCNPEPTTDSTPGCAQGWPRRWVLRWGRHASGLQLSWGGSDLSLVGRTLVFFLLLWHLVIPGTFQPRIEMRFCFEPQGPGAIHDIV